MTASDTDSKLMVHSYQTARLAQLTRWRSNKSLCAIPGGPASAIASRPCSFALRWVTDCRYSHPPPALRARIEAALQLLRKPRRSPKEPLLAFGGLGQAGEIISAIDSAIALIATWHHRTVDS